MNPTGTDLLDIFNSRPKRGSSPARATSRPTREPRSSGSPDGGSPGRGRLLLGGTVMVLLLALAFTAGVGVGRARRAPALPNDPMVRPTTAPVVRESWSLRSRALPNLSSKADNFKNRVVSELYRKWPDLEGRTYVADVLDKSGKSTLGQFRVILRDFDSRAEAIAAVGELGLWQIDGQMPFDGCRPERTSSSK